MNAVATSLGADIHDGLSGFGAAGVENLVGIRQANGHGVDQDIAVITFVEIGLAADCGHADTISVAANASDNPGDKLACLGMIMGTKAQSVERRDWPRAHGEDVAQNAANARRRTLIGFDIGRVVVALHLEHTGLAIANINHAGIFARALDDLVTLGREFPQMQARGFVGTMLGPHDRENTQLVHIWRTAHTIENDGIFLIGKAVFFDDFGSDAFSVLGHVRQIQAVIQTKPVHPCRRGLRLRRVRGGASCP